MPKTEPTIEELMFRGLIDFPLNSTGRSIYHTTLGNSCTFLPPPVTQRIRREYHALSKEQLITRLVTLKMSGQPSVDYRIDAIRHLHEQRLKQLEINKKRREKRAANVPRTDSADS